MKIKKRYFVLLFLLIAVSSFLYIANNKAVKYGYDNAFQVFGISFEHLVDSESPDVELNISIKDADYNALQKMRDSCLAYGMMIRSNKFVPAKISINGKTYNVKLRLKGHMTDHLKGDSWSYRILVQDNQQILVMTRFSLQHPGTRNYIYEYIYHKLASYQGLISLKYEFVNVKINNENMGIYALEEHFGASIGEHNKLPKGPIIRFNPRKYWEYRDDERKGQRGIRETATMASTYLNAYADNDWINDTQDNKVYKKGMNLLESFRRGEKSTSQTFDVDELAKFYAIIDLVGGWRSLDWSDVKYYYNDVTEKLQPVAYESTGAYPINRNLVGDNRFNGKAGFDEDIFNRMFSDISFFKAYISALNNISSDTLLNNFMALNHKDIQHNINVLYGQFPYKEFETDVYEINKNTIQSRLQNPSAIQCMLKKIKKDSLLLMVGGIDALPYEITAILIDSTTIHLLHPKLIFPRIINSPIKYVALSVPYSGKIKEKNLNNIVVKYKLLGLEDERSINVLPYSIDENYAVASYSNSTNLAEFPFIKVDDTLKEIIFTKDYCLIDHDLVLPEGYSVSLFPGTTVDLINKARIISYSQVLCIGRSDSPIIFTSSDKQGSGIFIRNVSENKFNYTIFKNLSTSSKNNGTLKLFKADAVLTHCTFDSIKGKAMVIYSSTVLLNSSLFQWISEECIEFGFSQITLQDNTCINGSRQAIHASFSNVIIRSLFIDNFKSGMLFEKNTEVSIDNTKITHAEVGIEAKSGSRVHSKNLNCNKVGLVAKALDNNNGYGKPLIELFGTIMKDVGAIYSTDKKNTIFIDAVSQPNNKDNKTVKTSNSNQ